MVLLAGQSIRTVQHSLITSWHVVRFIQVRTFTGTITANSGTLNNVTINDSCTILGTLSANRIVGPLMQSNAFNFYQILTQVIQSIGTVLAVMEVMLT
jgi:predicted phage tail protein